MTTCAQYVTLGLDRELFGMPVENVREILDMREISRLPHAPSYLLGIIDVRGQSVPIVDLRAKLGLPQAPITSSTRIVVLELPTADRHLVLGLIADRVLDVTSLDAETMDAPPEIGARWRSDYITGIGRRGESFVIVFDLAKLFAEDNVPLITTALASPPPPPTTVDMGIGHLEAGSSNGGACP
jgi:Chemotaxis signal transduction protein